MGISCARPANMTAQATSRSRSRQLPVQIDYNVALNSMGTGKKNLTGEQRRGVQRLL